MSPEYRQLFAPEIPINYKVIDPPAGQGVMLLTGSRLALTRLEAGIGFANHIHPATPFDDLAIGVAGLGSFQRGLHFHHCSSCDVPRTSEPKRWANLATRPSEETTFCFPV